VTERATTASDDGGGLLSVDQGEDWLLALGQALMITQTHGTALRTFEAAVAQVGDRLPPNRDLAGRALRLLEKQLRTIGERADREGRTP
jgi:hypothetical protein